MQQAELELQGMVPPELQFFFHEIIRLCRLYTNLDDLEHYQTTRLTPPLRRGLIELGSRLKRLCVVDDPLDVFMAGEAALDKAIASENDEGWDKLRAIIQANKSSFAQAQATEPAWTLEEHPAAPATEGQLTGIPGSAGIAEGAVYRVEGPEDFAGFPKGGILLARTTNPTWTPLFYLAAGVVTQSGGPLSHGAVTAREMQVPAVMSVQTAWESLKTGDRVRVDGVNGTVTKL
jgi:pyruvate,water dikinase